MRTLIIVTGTDRQIMRFWLPSLRGKGDYNGDILILNYDMNASSVEKLRKEETVIIRKVTRCCACFESDRIIAAYEYLMDIRQNYDVIMFTDGDVEFHKPVAPLFELAKEKFCYIEETMLCKKWFGWHLRGNFPNLSAAWKEIENVPVINTGVFIGPAGMMYKTLKFITENLSIKSTRGTEMLLINAYLRYYKPFETQRVGYEWNHLKGMHYTDGHEIAILHMVGSTHPIQLPRPR